MVNRSNYKDIRTRIGNMTKELVFDPDVEVSEQAQERKRIFRENKQREGLDAISFDSMFPERKIYFNSIGEITCVTQDKSYQPDPDWLTYDFSQAELDMVNENVGLSKFTVNKVHDAYEIVASTIKQPLGISQGSDMLHVEAYPGADISIEVKETEIVVSTTDAIASELKENNFSVDSTKVLPFYITMPGNPHYMLYNFYVPLGDLANKGSVKIPVEDDFTEYSVYTKPVFGRYGRI